MAEGEIDGDRIAAFCGVLVDHGVEFVVIGGVAARLYDTGHATVDIDICLSSVDEEACLGRHGSPLAGTLRFDHCHVRAQLAWPRGR